MGVLGKNSSDYPCLLTTGPLEKKLKTTFIEPDVLDNKKRKWTEDNLKRIFENPRLMTKGSLE